MHHLNSLKKLHQPFLRTITPVPRPPTSLKIEAQGRTIIYIPTPRLLLLLLRVCSPLPSALSSSLSAAPGDASFRRPWTGKVVASPCGAPPPHTAPGRASQPVLRARPRRRIIIRSRGTAYTVPWEDCKLCELVREPTLVETTDT